MLWFLFPLDGGRGLVVTSDNVTLYNGEWYFVKPNQTVTWSSRITANGDVNQVLTDGSVMEAVKGISVVGGSLTIWGQSGGTGKLRVTDPESTLPGIGNFHGYNLTITISGGNVTAENADHDYGIGSGSECKKCSVTTTLTYTDATRNSIYAKAYEGPTVTLGEAFKDVAEGTVFPKGEIQNVSDIAGKTLVAYGTYGILADTTMTHGTVIPDTSRATAGNGVTLTVAAPANLIYDGLPKEATVTGNTELLGMPMIICLQGSTMLPALRRTRAAIPRTLKWGTIRPGTIR